MDCDRRGMDYAAVLEEIAVGYGQALSFAKYKGWKNPRDGRRNDRDVVASDRMVYDYFEKVPRLKRAPVGGNERRLSFKPYDQTLSQSEATAAANRCMHCGRCTECDNCLIFCPDVSVFVRGAGCFGYAIDYDYCKGCGICFTECPRHAITMVSQGAPEEEV